MATRTLLYTLALAGALFFGDEVSACSCKGPPTAKKEIVKQIGGSDVVLLGFLEEGNVRIWALGGELTRSVHFTISPVKWFKGKRPKQRIEMELDPQDCLSEFLPGSVVLVFASETGEGNRPLAHSCQMYIYELAKPEYPSENADLRARLGPVLDMLRSRSW